MKKIPSTSSRSSSVPPHTVSRGPGRPRDAALDARILDAALRRLGADGFEGMTMEGVAREAGVPKPTLYRRWAGKEDLATAALARLQAQEPPPRAADGREELVQVLANFGRSLLRPNGLAMIGTLLVEERRHPELIRLFRERVVAPRRRMVRAALQRSVAEGTISGGRDLDAAANLLVGSFYARYLTGDGVPRTWARRVVDLVWSGLAR